MAHPSTLYRFRIDLSDVDRGAYEAIDFRIAMHPSETTQFLITRVLAFVLNFQDGIEFSPGGLSDPDEPCIRVPDGSGSNTLWIEVGNPSARKLHKAAKSARAVKVYTYKDAELLMQDIADHKVYNAERIEIYALAPKFLDRLAETLVRDTSWNVMHSDGTLTVSSGEVSESIELKKYSVSS